MSTITSLADVIPVALQAKSRTNHTDTWWRGQPNATHKLIPGAFRSGRSDVYERATATRFRVKARTRHAPCPDEDDFASWLFLMQHHGLPTRLLDWTESPIVATYFVVTKNQDRDGALWALDPFTLTHTQIGKLHIMPVQSSEIQLLVRSAFGLEPRQENVFPIITNEIDLRMLVQLSTFTIHGSPKPLDDYDQTGRFLEKHIIPAACKHTILQELEVIGVTLATLFPDLDNLAEHLKNRSYFALSADNLTDVEAEKAP